MLRIDKRRRLPAMVLLAALGTAGQGIFAEFPSQRPIQFPAPPTVEAQVEIPRSEPPAPATQIKATPEQIGDALQAHQRYQAAIEAYKKADPTTAVVWNKMGIAYQMMFNMDGATRCYKASLKLDPKNPRVLNNLGTVYDSLKQYGDAERMYHKALNLDPKSALIHKNLGTALLAQHKYKKGWEAYKAALAVDPQIFEEHNSPRTENTTSVAERGAMNYYMAKGCARAGLPDQAIEYLRLALNEGFTNPKKIAADDEFASLRGAPAFQRLLAEQSSPGTASTVNRP